jgi:hypothetical protein
MSMNNYRRSNNVAAVITNIAKSQGVSCAIISLASMRAFARPVSLLCHNTEIFQYHLPVFAYVMPAMPPLMVWVSDAHPDP